MAASEPPDRTASNKKGGVDGSRSEALNVYLTWLEGRPLAARSRQAYGHQVRRYLTWLGDRSPVDGDPLADEAARDWAVRDYKRHLKATRSSTASRIDEWRPRNGAARRPSPRSLTRRISSRRDDLTPLHG